MAKAPRGQFGPVVIEVKAGIQSVRSLRDAIIQLVYQLTGRPSTKALLVLPGLRLTRARLMEEQEHARNAIRPEIMKRIEIVSPEEGELSDLAVRLSPPVMRRLRELIQLETARNVEHLSRKDSFYTILTVMLLHWLKDKPPMTAKHMSEVTGYSYPTVARFLARLAHHIQRYSGKRVGLKSFPRDEWARLLAVSDQVRSTTGFIDTSGQPRTPDKLMRRIREMGRDDIAIGGIHGALYHQPELDFVGSPRLDLTVHCPKGKLDISFVSRLDPGFERLTEFGRQPNLLVHVLRRKESFFERGKDHFLWADPVECLLDLHEAHLESQALEFLNRLVARRKKSP